MVERKMVGREEGGGEEGGRWRGGERWRGGRSRGAMAAPTFSPLWVCCASSFPSWRICPGHGGRGRVKPRNPQLLPPSAPTLRPGATPPRSSPRPAPTFSSSKSRRFSGEAYTARPCGSSRFRPTCFFTLTRSPRFPRSARRRQGGRGGSGGEEEDAERKRRTQGGRGGRGGEEEDAGGEEEDAGGKWKQRPAAPHHPGSSEAPPEGGFIDKTLNAPNFGLLGRVAAAAGGGGRQDQCPPSTYCPRAG